MLSVCYRTSGVGAVCGGRALSASASCFFDVALHMVVSHVLLASSWSQRRRETAALFVVAYLCWRRPGLSYTCSSWRCSTRGRRSRALGVLVVPAQRRCFGGGPFRSRLSVVSFVVAYLVLSAAAWSQLHVFVVASLSARSTSSWLRWRRRLLLWVVVF